MRRSRPRSAASIHEAALYGSATQDLAVSPTTYVPKIPWRRKVRAAILRLCDLRAHSHAGRATIEGVRNCRAPVSLHHLLQR